MLKKYQVVILPTNEKANLYLHNTKGLHLLASVEHEQGVYNGSNQHLYILSDEEIKEGDWFIQTTYQGVFKCLKKDNNYIYFNNNSYEPIDYCKKIIATTDNSLLQYIGNDIRGREYDSQYQLPKPSQQFIEKYVEEYNKGNIITEVMVEYINNETGNYREFDSCTELDRKLKINPKDNTITIKKVKDCWNKKDEDLRIAFEKFACDVYDENYNTDMNFKKRAELMSKQWIEKNL